MQQSPNPAHQQLLRDNLAQIFGEFDQAQLTLIEPLLTWMSVAGGDHLFHQHDAGDALYFVVSGRLRAYIRDAHNTPQVIGEISRGETVGEMSVFTGENRTASVVAIRDSILVRLTREVFQQVIYAYPTVSFNVTRLIINRLKALSHSPRTQGFLRPDNLCLYSLHSSVAVGEIATGLAAELHKKGTTLLLTAETVDIALGITGIAQIPASATEESQRLARWLDQMEADHDFLVYVADVPNTEWSNRCLRQSDEILMVADAAQPPILTPAEQPLATAVPGQLQGARQTLLLVHPADTAMPDGTRHWLDIRPEVGSHCHIRIGNASDMARLGRIVSRSAIGLVLAGGGAKGFAHVGVYRALEEAGIPVDFVGGTSVGAMVASAIAFGQPWQVVYQHLHQGARFNPTGDLNPFPLISLMQGRRIREMIRRTILAFTGKDTIDLTDTWRTCFMVSSNYSQAREEVHISGDMLRRLLATTAIPGVFPPIISGNDLLVDGGTFNNFPADVMRRMGAGKVIGVDLAIDKPRALTITDIPGPWALLRDQFRPRRKRRYRLPGLTAILLNATMLYSAARRNETRQYLDLYLNPDVSRFGLMNWKAFEPIAAAGYVHTKEVLEALSTSQKAAFSH